jgi:hypothetical protein
MPRRSVVTLCALVVAAPFALAQQQRPLSPPGTASTEIGGTWVEGERGPRYEGGRWIDVTYSRPIKRDRKDLFGGGAEYGKAVTAGAPVWRAGANQSTRFKTEAPLTIGGMALPAGEYSLFVDLKNEREWTLILSGHAAQQKYDPEEKTALWGAFNYTPDKDVLRAPMQVESLPFSVDQFTIAFLDVTSDGGRLALMWDRTMAAVSFRLAEAGTE